MTHSDALRIKELGIYTFATNSMVFLEPWINCIVAHDSAWWNKYLPNLSEFRGKRLSNHNVKGCEVLKGRSWDKFMNSGSLAVAYAIRAGYKNIILLGADCSLEDGYHCHGNHPKELSNCKSVNRWSKDFGYARQLADENGARVINASRKTALTCFEKQSLEDCISGVAFTKPKNVMPSFNKQPLDDRIIISGGGGIGDAIYVKCIADAVNELYPDRQITAYTKYPEIFSQSPHVNAIKGASGDGIKAHYVTRKSKEGTTQWEDVKIVSGVDSANLDFKWKAVDMPLIDTTRKIALVSALRPPMNRPKGVPWVDELLPNPESYRALVKAVSDAGYLTVEIGRGEKLHECGAEVSLFGATTIEQVFDLASICDLIVSPPSFMLVMAESMGIKAISMWARKGLNSRQAFINTITPEKVIHRKDLVRVVYDDDDSFDDAIHSITG